ncbi:MAG: putative alginate lyase [Benjaminiella poitrasii]|nr:MAG: putative alginate lyase [Benjaminiella poitrasii]
MGPRKPEVEYISLRKLQLQKQRGPNDTTKEAYHCLERLANNALKSGPFSITFGKQPPHVAPSGNVHDFLSYAPYWWPESNSSNTKYVRKDGKRNPDIGVLKDQSQLESIAESLTFLCLGYYFFNNENYAIHAVSLLDTFFINQRTCMNPNLNYAQLIRGVQNKTKLGRGEGVISSRVLARIANVLPLLETFNGYYILKQHIINWFRAYLSWLQTSPVALEAARAKNNIHTWYIVQVTSIEQFLNPLSSHAPNLVLKFFNESLPKQLDSKTGNQPLESKRAKPLHYLAFNLQAIIFLAELAKNTIGIDIYRANNSIQLATRYITNFTGKDQDITEAARCVEIVLSGIEDQDNCCRRFIDACYHCKYTEKISGPKNAIHILWS